MASKTALIKQSESVYRLVGSIPKGKVATYGQIAYLSQNANIKNTKPYFPKEKQNYSSKLKISPRIVGWILHANRSADVPCHRVVDRNGRIAPNYAFGGAAEQRRRLITEGVKFKDEMHVDLEACRW